MIGYLGAIACVVLIGTPLQKPAFRFDGKGYFKRYSTSTMTEYTPAGQENLKTWTDMVTVNQYPDAGTGDGLADRANSVLEIYKANGAMVVRTDSKPRTASKPAEHLIVVLFPQPEFIEAAFARFVIVGGKGRSIVYSHRIYGKKAGDPMSAWLRKNGERCEKSLMKFVGG